MSQSDRWWIGRGPTPRDAVRDLVPDADADHVAWVSGVERVPDRVEPERFSDGTQVEVTVIYERRDPKQWGIVVNAVDDAWEAVFTGSKKI